MNRISAILAGIFLTFALSWFGLVYAPYLQTGRLKEVVGEDQEVFPRPLSGTAAQGRKVYVENGCVYCHTQQIRDANQGSDLERGWGERRTVARDYMNEKPHLIGTMRTGPDLSNVGKRQTSAEWHHKHLYRPDSVSLNSVMPPFRYLYKVQKIEGQSSVDALKLDGRDAPKDGYEVIPTPEAKALVDYLLSLKHDYPLPESPID